MKALEQIPNTETTCRLAAVFTDSKVTIDALKNLDNHSFLIEEIRSKVRHLNMQRWSIHFGWVKAHIGIEGNEEAHRLAKEAAQEDDDQNTAYNRIPVTTIATEINRKGIVQWQGQWDGTEKGAACRSFFPVLDRRLKMKIPVTPEFTAIVTGHGKTRSYLHRFKMINNLTCTCNEGHQTPDHLIYECKLLLAQRSSLIKHIMIRGGVWPSTHDELVTTYLNAFAKFIKDIDFQKLH